MSYYLYQLSYSSEAMKAMIAKPSDREAAARKLIEAAGGKLHHLFFAFGKYDVVCLTEAPNDMIAMAVAAAVGHCFSRCYNEIIHHGRSDESLGIGG
jgi:uncharacterized protein with GYD domain